MKYEKPEVKTLIPAINAIQSSTIEVNKSATPRVDTQAMEGHPAYADWED